MVAWVKMSGPFGGVIHTSEGPSVVAPDGTFFVPTPDVAAIAARGGYLVGESAASIRVGSFLLYENQDSGGLEIRTPIGTIVPLVGGET